MCRGTMILGMFTIISGMVENPQNYRKNKGVGKAFQTGTEAE